LTLAHDNHDLPLASLFGGETPIDALFGLVRGLNRPANCSLASIMASLPAWREILHGTKYYFRRY
jgi:hypothetical protein